MLHARVAVETWALRSFRAVGPGRRVAQPRDHLAARPPRDGGDRPLAHLRLSADGRWHLYRRGALGDWWPVSLHDTGDGRDIYRSLAVVRDDRLRLFCPGPPREERHTRP